MLVLAVAIGVTAKKVYVVQVTDLETKTTFILVKGYEDKAKAQTLMNQWLEFCVEDLESQLKTPEDYEKKEISKMKRNINLYKLNKRSYNSDIKIADIVEIDVQ